MRLLDGLPVATAGSLPEDPDKADCLETATSESPRGWTAGRYRVWMSIKSKDERNVFAKSYPEVPLHSCFTRPLLA